MGRLWQYFVQVAGWLNELSRGWLGVLANAVKETLKPESAILAGAIAYFALFSLFPFTLLSISIASFNIGTFTDHVRLIQKLEFVVPALGQLLGQNINEIIQARGPVTGLALVGLLWSASTIFYTLTQMLTTIWGHKRIIPIWKRRGLSILIGLSFVAPALFLASFTGSLITDLQTWWPAQLSPIIGSASFGVALLLDFALFMVLYRTLPHGDSTWREILPGAIGAGLLWELAKKSFLFFIATYISLSNLVYGSAAAVIAFLAWAYLSGLIFLFGAFFSVSYYQLKQKR